MPVPLGALMSNPEWNTLLRPNGLRRQPKALEILPITGHLNALDDESFGDDLVAFADAVQLLHAPPPGTPEAALQTRAHPAWRRIKFDEVLAQQLSLRRAYLARREKGAPSLVAAGTLAARLLDTLPFALTGAQRRVLRTLPARFPQRPESWSADAARRR